MEKVDSECLITAETGNARLNQSRLIRAGNPTDLSACLCQRGTTLRQHGRLGPSCPRTSERQMVCLLEAMFKLWGEINVLVSQQTWRAFMGTKVLMFCQTCHLCYERPLKVFDSIPENSITEACFHQKPTCSQLCRDVFSASFVLTNIAKTCWRFKREGLLRRFGGWCADLSPVRLESNVGFKYLKPFLRKPKQSWDVLIGFCQEWGKATIHSFLNTNC